MPDVYRRDGELVERISDDAILQRLLPNAQLTDALVVLERAPAFILDAIAVFPTPEERDLDPEIHPREGKRRPMPTGLLQRWDRRLGELMWDVVYSLEHALDEAESTHLVASVLQLRTQVAYALGKKYGVKRRNMGVNDTLWRVVDALEHEPHASKTNLFVAAAWILHLAGMRPLEAEHVRAIQKNDRLVMGQVAKAVGTVVKRRRSRHTGSRGAESSIE